MHREPFGAPLGVVLEFARADEIGDPHALPERPTRYFLRRERGGYVEGVLRWNGALRRRLEAIRTRASSPEDRQVVGRALRTFLANFGWDQHEVQIREALAAGRPVVITIRSAAAELFRLPWPLLTLGDSDRHLGAMPDVLFRSEWPETQTAPAGPNSGTERILVAWSAATRPVPWGRHVDAIAQACERGDVPFDRTADVLGNATPKALAERLSAVDPEHPIGVLHLLCHGASIGDAFGLGFDGENGSPVAVDAAMMRELLGPFADRVRLVVICACDAANEGPWDATLGSVAQALHRAGFAAVVAPRYPLSGAGSVSLTQSLYRHLLEGPASLESAVRATGRELLVRHPDDIEWLSVQLYARAADGDDSRPITIRPYRGLLPFQANHVRFFFGRDPERAETLARLDALYASGQPRFLVVAGASGTGKSSMVLSGAATDLQARARAQADEAPATATALERVIDQLRRLMPGIESPAVREGARQLVDALPSAAQGGATGWRIASMRPGSKPLRALKAQLHGLDGRDEALLLVVDQFEEIFTQDVDPVERDAFVHRLWRLAQADRPRTDVVITIRVDFLGHCGQIAVDDSGLRLDKIAYDDQHQVFVAQLDPDQMRQVIEAPARKVGLQLEAGLAERMLADVSGEPGALPVLQYALDLLWQNRSGRTLTQAAYEEMGGVTGALHGKADGIIDSFDALHESQARRLLVRLVSTDEQGARDTRRRVFVDQIRPPGAAEAVAFDDVLAELVDARLLYRGEEDGRTTVEVAHEALIRRWQRLHGWLADDYDMLRQVRELDQWVTHFTDYGATLQGNQLGYARRVREKYPDQISEAALELIDLSEAAVERVQRRRQRRIRLIIAASIAVALVMGVLALQAYQAQRKAVRATEAAEKATGEAKQKAEEARAAEQLALHQKKRAEDSTAQARRAEGNTRMAYVTNLAGRLKEDRALAAALLQSSAGYRDDTRNGNSAEDAAYWARWTTTAADLLSRPIPRARFHLGADEANAKKSTVHVAGELALPSPDGSKIATVDAAGTIRVRRSDGRGDPIAVFEGLTIPVDASIAPPRARGAPPPAKSGGDRHRRGAARRGRDAPWWRQAGWRGRTPKARKQKKQVAAPEAPPQEQETAHGAAAMLNAAMERANPEEADVVEAAPPTDRPWRGRICGWRPDGGALLLCGDGVYMLDLATRDIVPLHLRGRATPAVWCPDELGARVAAPAEQETPVDGGGTLDEKGFAVWRAGVAEWFVPLPGALEALACNTTGQIIAAEFDPLDGRGHRVRLWLAQMPDRAIELQREASQIAFSPDGRAIAGISNGRLRVWAIDPDRIKRGGKGLVFRPSRPLGPSVPLNSRPAWSPDGRHLAVAARDGRIYVVRVEPPRTVATHAAVDVVDVDWADGGHLVSRSASGVVRVHRAFDGEVSPTLLTRSGEGGMRVWAPRCKPSRDGACARDQAAMLLTRSELDVIDVWSLAHEATREAARVVHGEEVDWLWMSDDGRFLSTLAGQSTRSLRRWDLERLGRPPAVLPARDGIGDVHFTGDMRFVALTLPDQERAEIYDLRTPEKATAVIRQQGLARALLSPDAERIALITDDCVFRFVTAEGRLLEVPEGQDAVSRGCDVGRLSISPDGLRIAAPNGREASRRVATSGRHVTRIWSFETPRRAGRAFATERRVEALDWSDDGRRIALVGAGFAVVVEPALPGDLAQHDTRLIVPEGALAISPGRGGVALDPRGRRLAVVDDGRVLVWSLTRPGKPRAIPGRFGNLAWSSDGQHLALIQTSVEAGGAGQGGECPGDRPGVAVFDLVGDEVQWLCPGHDADSVRFVPPIDPQAPPVLLSAGFDDEHGRTAEICALGAPRCGRLEGNAPRGPVVLGVDDGNVQTVTIVDAHLVRTWDVRRRYDRKSLQEALARGTNYCPPLEILHALLPVEHSKLVEQQRQCHARIGRDANRLDAPAAKEAATADVPDELTRYARVNRDFPPMPDAESPAVARIRWRLERLEEEARWLPEGTGPHAESRASRARFNVDFAHEIARSARPDKDAAVEQALRTARYFYRSAIKAGHERRRLGWYRDMLAVSERLHGDRFAPGVLDDACREDMLIDIDIDIDDETSEPEVSFARSRHCANLLADASADAEAAGDLQRAARLMSEARAVYPPHRRGLSREEKKRLYLETRHIRKERDRLKRALRKAR